MSMQDVQKDFVKEITDGSTEGTGGAYQLNGSLLGFRSFGSVMADGQTCHYAAVGGGQFEAGVGTYDAVNNALTRTSVLDSSNGGDPVDWGAGVKTVYQSPLAAAIKGAAYRGVGTAAGNVMEVGAFGLGVDSAPQPPNNDFDAVTTTGWTASVSADHAPGPGNWLVWTGFRASNRAVQVAYKTNPSGGVVEQQMRVLDGDGWSSWRKIPIPDDSGGVDFEAMPTVDGEPVGRLVQVQRGSHDTDFSTTSSSAQDTGLEVSITPRVNGSTIIFSAVFNGRVENLGNLARGEFFVSILNSSSTIVAEAGAALDIRAGPAGGCFDGVRTWIPMHIEGELLNADVSETYTADLRIRVDIGDEVFATPLNRGGVGQDMLLYAREYI